MKKPIIDEKILGTTPFINLFNIPVNTIYFKNQYFKNKDGELETLKREVEQTPFIRMFINSDKRKIVNKLYPSTKDLYLWLLFTIESGKDYVWINKTRYMEETETSVNTYKKAITQLVTEHLLLTTNIKDVFWINPDMFFRGDRVKKYPQNILLLKSKEETINELLT